MESSLTPRTLASFVLLCFCGLPMHVSADDSERVAGADGIQAVASSQAADPTFVAQAARPQVTITAYGELLARAKRGDATLDFTALRMAFTETPPYVQKQIEVQMIAMVMYRQLSQLMDQQRHADALKLAQTLIDSCFVDVNAHLVAAVASTALDNAERATFHRFIADGLLASITVSGDGKTEATAFQAILVSDEYALIVRSMGLRPIGVATKIQGDHHFDLFTAVNADGERVSYYFNIDREFAGMKSQ